MQFSFKPWKKNFFFPSISLGSLFAYSSANQMFDSSTSGRDIYLEQGDLAQFEPPFLDSGWTVRSLSDGTRGTAPNPALKPVDPFHQWVTRIDLTHTYIYAVKC